MSAYDKTIRSLSNQPATYFKNTLNDINVLYDKFVYSQYTMGIAYFWQLPLVNSGTLHINITIWMG